MMHHLRTHWTLAAVIATIAAAAIDPPLGLRWYKVGSRVLITSLFALLGLTLQLGQLRDGLLDLRSHCPIQACSLLLIPTLYYVLVFRWDFGVVRSASVLARPWICCPLRPTPRLNGWSFLVLVMSV